MSKYSVRLVEGTGYKMSIVIKNPIIINGSTRMGPGQNSSPIVTTNLIMYYDFGNTSSYAGSGTTVTDLSGNGLNATLLNTPTYSSASGGYMNFSGTSHAKIINSTIGTIGTGDFSIDLWIYFPNAAGYGHIYSIDSQYAYTFKHYNGGLYDAWSNANGGGGGAVGSGAWKHVVLSRTSGTAKYYVNTAQAASRAHSANITATTLYIRGEGGMSEWVSAYIALPKLYKKGLTVAEITQNYNAHKSRFGL